MTSFFLQLLQKNMSKADLIISIPPHHKCVLEVIFEKVFVRNDIPKKKIFKGDYILQSSHCH